jgi:hypothetical protein
MRRPEARAALLPAIAAIATVSAVAAVPTATSASAAATAAMTAASAAVSAASATTASFSLRPRLVHYEITSAKILAVQSIDGAIRVFIAGNFDERETARLPGKTVPDEIYA